MSWELIKRRPTKNRAEIVRWPVTVAVSKPGRLTQRLIVTVRTALMDGLPTWWVHGATVDCEIGRDEHAGRLRIQPGKQHDLSKPKNTGTKFRAPMLHLQGVTGLSEQGQTAWPADWEILGDALVITLPWAGVKGACKADAKPVLEAAKPPVSAPPAPPATKPPVTVPATPKPVLPQPVPKAQRTLTAAEMAALNKLRRGRGRVALGALTHVECRVLRQLEARGFAAFSPGTAGGWSMTPQGERMLDADTGVVAA